MRNKIVMTGMPALIVVVWSLTLSSSISAAGPVTLTGTVGDAMCGPKHPEAEGAALCTRDCVKAGSDYALVVGGRAYTLKADTTAKAELNKLAGQMAEVSGEINGTTLVVKSVKAAAKKK